MTERLGTWTFLTCLFLSAGPSWAASPVVLDEELDVQAIEPSVHLVVHRFPSPCNSLIVRCSEKAFVWVDTPCSNEATEQVHQWLLRTYADPNVIQINTGFPNDNLAGNGYLIAKGIPCYGSDLTPKLIAECWDQTVQKVLPYYERHENKKYRDHLLNQKLVPPPQQVLSLGPRPEPRGRRRVCGGPFPRRLPHARQRCRPLQERRHPVRRLHDQSPERPKPRLPGRRRRHGLA